MKIYIVIPAYNEAGNIEKTLQSLVSQTLLPDKLLVVNDNSTDDTAGIVAGFSKNHPFISLINSSAEGEHSPGSKVINAFNIGYSSLDENYDIICKFDADLIFPGNYLKKLDENFQKNPQAGIAGGFCTIFKNGVWQVENLTDKDHVRGALKAYRKECFNVIGGLKPAMGWDTLDELLAQFHGWEIRTIDSLHVKHLKATGATYTRSSKLKQGLAFYRLRYGLVLSLVASAKLAVKKGDSEFFINCVEGYFSAKKNKIEFLVSEEEGRFIRNLRWKKIREKIFYRK